MSRELVVQMSGLAVMSPEDYWNELNNTVFKGKHVDNSRKFAFLGVCNTLGLNPVQKEVYYMEQGGTWSAVISVDGWIKIATRHPDFDGLDFEDKWSDDGKTLISVSAVIKRKSWAAPMRITEYLQYCSRPTKPWKDNPLRMLRHKAVGQAVRYAFGIAGVPDIDDWERMAEFDNSSTQIERNRETEINPMPNPDLDEVLSLIDQSASVNDLSMIKEAIKKGQYALTETQQLNQVGPAMMVKFKQLTEGGITYESAN